MGGGTIKKYSLLLCVILSFQLIMGSCSMGFPAENIEHQDAIERLEEEKISKSLHADAPVLIYSEYDMLLQKAEELAEEDTPAAADLVREYENEIRRRANLPQETLLQYGYSEDEITLLKAYIAGELSFEEIAPLTAADLEANLRATMRSAERYALRYDWEWDKVPVGLGEDGVALAYYGLDANNDTFNIRLADYVSVVNYYTMGNEFKEFDEGKVDLVWDNLSTTFDSYKLDETGYEWVWAKNGYMIAMIEPATPGTDEFNAVRVQASYGHSTAKDTLLQISFNVSVLNGLLDIGFSVGSGGEVVEYGTKQCYFYLDGSTHTEIG